MGDARFIHRLQRVFIKHLLQQLEESYYSFKEIKHIHLIKLSYFTLTLFYFHGNCVLSDRRERISPFNLTTIIIAIIFI